MSESTSSTTRRTAWGRTRFGAGRLPALAVATPIGLVMAVAEALLFARFVGGPLPAPLLATIFSACVLVPNVLLVWALIIDRTTLSGALERPEESVESQWYDEAARGAFHDTIAITGLALTFLAITGTHIDGVLALTGVLILAFLSTSIRYTVARSRGRA